MEGQLGITDKRICQILFKDLGTRMTHVEVCFSLAREQTKYKVTIFTPKCHTSLHFVDCIITVDESQVFQCFPPKTKRQRTG